MREVALPEWNFAQRQRMSKQRDPVQGEFFNTESIETAADEIVREAFQNSLDAGVVFPVRVRIYVSGPDGALAPAKAAHYFKNLRRHADSCGAPTHLLDKPCSFVVLEDFGTTGLRGDELTAEEPEHGEKNDFFYFFRAEGKSGKAGADRGRWASENTSFPKPAACMSSSASLYASRQRTRRTALY